MPAIRKTFQRRGDDQGVHFITFSCFRRLPLLAESGGYELWAEHLTQAVNRGGIRVHAYVFMPEHTHMLLSVSPGKRVSSELQRLKGGFAHQWLDLLRERGYRRYHELMDSQGRHAWLAGGGYDRVIVSDHEFHEKVEYMHRNPVRRGLVGSAGDWPWSSYRWYRCGKTTPVPTTRVPTLPVQTSRTQASVAPSIA